MHFHLFYAVPFQVNLKMREITEKEIKLKQQLMESPGHQKVKHICLQLCFCVLLIRIQISQYFLCQRNVRHPVLETPEILCMQLVLCPSSGPSLTCRAHWYLLTSIKFQLD